MAAGTLVSVPNQEEMEARVAQIDLRRILDRLCSSAEIGGKDWSPEDAHIIENEYREFLVLCGMYPHLSFVPTKMVDELWHAHILDTSAYARDCTKTFGYFLHHYPDYDPEMRREQRSSGYEQTREMYRKHFGHDLTEFAGLCQSCYCDD